MSQEVARPKLLAPALGGRSEQVRVATADAALGRGLELAQVEQHNRERRSFAARSRQLAWDLFLPRALVRQAGRVIDLDHGLELQQKRGPLDHAGGLGG